MRKLVYWVAPHLTDRPCYSIVGKTRTAVYENAAYHPHDVNFGPIVKASIEYDDAFDLFEKLTGEGCNQLIGVAQNANNA